MSPAGRHEALVALARAVFAEGGRIVVPADVGVALVIGTVALEYAQPPVAERRAEAAPSPLIVMETELTEHAARTLLAPLAIRGALSYLDTEGSEVPPDPGAVVTDQPGLDEIRRQHVSPRMVHATHPTVAVAISPARPALQDLAVLRELQVPTLVFRDSVLESDLVADLGDIEDPTERLLQQTPEGRWSRPPQPESARQVLPYAYLMQRLVAEWTGRHR